jgi:hypothetical protein
MSINDDQFTLIKTDLTNKLINIKTEDIEEFSFNGLKTIGKIVECYDGDTCKIILIANNTLNKFTCRLNNVDAPEMKPPLDKPNRLTEIAMACKCRNRLLQLSTNCFDNCDINCQYKKIEVKTLLLSNTKLIGIECLEFDKYGRLLVNLYDTEITDKAGTTGTTDKVNIITYNQQLILDKLVKQYNGGTKEGF